MNSYDLECMELVFFLIFLFFERGTVIDIIFANFKTSKYGPKSPYFASFSLKYGPKSPYFVSFPLKNMALKAHIL